MLAPGGGNLEFAFQLTDRQPRASRGLIIMIEKFLEPRGGEVERGTDFAGGAELVKNVERFKNESKSPRKFEPRYRGCDQRHGTKLRLMDDYDSSFHERRFRYI